MKMKHCSFLIGLLCVFACCGFSACEGNEEHSSLESSIESSIESSNSEVVPQAPLTTPTLVLNADYSITWEEVEGASAYVINVNGEDLPIKTTICYVQPFTSVGNYQVKVKALRGIEETDYSESVQYSVYSVEWPISEQYDIISVDTVYSGGTYSFEFVAKDEAYDFSNVVVYANGKKVSLRDNIGTIKNVSENIVLTVEGITPLTVYQVSKSQGEGYSIVGNDYAVEGKAYTFQVALQDGFTDSTPIVKVNGSTLQAVDGVYTLKRVMSNINIVVTNVSFSGTIVQKLFRVSTWTEEVKIADGYVTVSDTKMALPVNWLKQLIGEGYTHLTFNAKINDDVADGISVWTGENVLRSAAYDAILSGYTFRIDLSNLKEFDLTLQMQDALGTSLSIGNVKAYKYAESWTKSSELAYICEENGQIIVDTYDCGENVEIYKTNAIRVLGGVNAALIDENKQPIYFSIATPATVFITDMDYYAMATLDEANRSISVTTLKDEGKNRPIFIFEQSKAYVKNGSPYADITIQSQEINSIEYVYGDGHTIQEKSLIYQTKKFACELVEDSYKNNAFQIYSTTADIGSILKVCFVESSFENEFYTSKAWNNINGGTKKIENGQLAVTDSWQINLNASWLSKLYDAGYHTLEFDVKLLNIPYFQQYDTSAPTEGYFEVDGNGIAHVTIEISKNSIVFRGKLKDGTDYNDPTAIAAFSVLIYNLTIN